MARVFLEAFLNAVEQGAGDRIGDLVELRLARGEQEVEQLKGGCVVGKYQGNAARRDAAAEVDFHEPVVWVVVRVGCPAGRWVAVEERNGVPRIGAGPADTAA